MLEKQSEGVAIKLYNIYLDIFIENGDIAIVVEVKYKMREHHFEEFFNKMEKYRQYADRKQDKRKFYGAIAAVIINDEHRKKVVDNGIYLIEPSGDSMKINIPDDFKPRLW